MATKLTRTKTCNSCSGAFTAQRSDAKFCSPACRKADSVAKKAPKTPKPSKDERFSSDRLCTVLMAQCRRAGTVEVLGTDIDLIALDDLTAFARGCNGWDDGNFVQTWDVCHLSPVKGLGTLGLFHHKNLFVGLSSHNKTVGTTDHECGLSIERSQLQSKWLVTKDTTSAQLEAMIRKFIPKAELERFLASRPTKVNGIEAKRRELLKWQAQLVDLDPDVSSIPEPLQHLYQLNILKAPRDEITKIHTTCRDILGVQGLTRAATGFFKVVAQEAERLVTFAHGGRKRCLLQLIELLRLFSTHRDGWSPLATFDAYTADLIESETFEMDVMDLFHGDHKGFHYGLQDILPGITLHAFEAERPLHDDLKTLGQVAPFQMSDEFKASTEYRWGIRFVGPAKPDHLYRRESSGVTDTPAEPRWKTQMAKLIEKPSDAAVEVETEIALFPAAPSMSPIEVAAEERRKAEVLASATDESPFD